MAMTATERAGPAAGTRWSVIILLGFAIWLVVGMVDCAWYYIMISAKGLPPSWKDTLRLNIPYWLLAGALTPFAVWVARHAPFEKGRRWRTVGIHIAAVIPFAIIHIAVFQAIIINWKGSAPGLWKFLSLIPKLVATTFDKELLLYLVIVGTVYITDYYTRYRERARVAAALELERVQLRASLSEAKLEALQMQLQPHFLFNALHAISTLILKGDSRAANQMLSHLSHFLRMTLDSSNTPLVPLAVELEFLEAYLRIQKERFGDRLHVITDIDERALTAAVPNLVLQPLVENSICHGIGADPDAGTITVRARLNDGSLSLEVEDDGVGLPASEVVREGVGIANIRARLAQLYPESHGFLLAPRSPRGTLATITLPFRKAGVAPSTGNPREEPVVYAGDGPDSNTDRR